MIKIPLLLFAFLFFSQNLEAQTDTVPPTLVCKQYSSIGFVLCNLSLSANDFIENLSDDFTPTGEIQLGIRKRCTGFGFPENQTQVTYSDGNEIGYQTVELWARDNAGNLSSCFSNFWLNDVGFNCKGGLVASAYTPNGLLINAVNFRIKGQNCMADSVDFEGITTDAFSPPLLYIYHIWSAPLRPGYAFTVTPSKYDEPLNGVTDLDITLIFRHILGIEPFDSPYKIIAADANQDGQVTTLDIKILQQLIIGNIDQLPYGKSWRFVPYNHEFPSVIKPYAAPFPEIIDVSNTEDPMPNAFNFIGVKIGDVNFSADAH